MEDLKVKFRAYKIHVFYIIVLLSLSIIGLITIKWTVIPDLVNYITFALTLSSLVLSILAIVYSFISNSQFSETMGALSSVTKDALHSTEKLNNITDSLSYHVKEIPSSLKEIVDQTTKTNEFLQDNSYNRTENNILQNKEWNRDSIKSFIERSSYIGKKLIYACCISFKEQKGFILNELFETGEEYPYGYFIALSAMDLISYTETAKVILIKNMNENLSYLIKDLFLEHAFKNDDKKTESEKSIFSWVRDSEKVEKYFTEIK